MDISEILDSIITALYFSAAFAFVIVGVYFAVRSRRAWLRIVLFAFSTLLIAATGFSLWFDLDLMAGTTMHRPAIHSPDGKHIAIVDWTLSGAIGFDHVRVRVRSQHSPFATEVFTGIAQNPPDDPEVLWTDERHLLISYWKDGHIERCQGYANQIRGVEVLCRD